MIRAETYPLLWDASFDFGEWISGPPYTTVGVGDFVTDEHGKPMSGKLTDADVSKLMKGLGFIQ